MSFLSLLINLMHLLYWLKVFITLNLSVYLEFFKYIYIPTVIVTVVLNVTSTFQKNSFDCSFMLPSNCKQPSYYSYIVCMWASELQKSKRKTRPEWKEDTANKESPLNQFCSSFLGCTSWWTFHLFPGKHKECLGRDQPPRSQLGQRR